MHELSQQCPGLQTEAGGALVEWGQGALLAAWEDACCARQVVAVVAVVVAVVVHADSAGGVGAEVAAIIAAATAVQVDVADL